MMKRAYLFFALLVMLGAVARGQTIAVTQSNASATRNEITADLKWPSSRTLTIMSGGTFHYAAGASFGGSGLEFLQDAGLPAVSLANAGKTIRINLAGNAYEASDAGAGTVTSFAFTNANGIAGSVTNATTTPTLSLSLGAITPTSVNGLTLTTSTGTLTIANGKTLTASNTLTLAGTDSSTLNIGSGGTLGTAAFTAATAYATSAQGTKADNAGAVNGIVKSNGSATFSAAVSGTDYAPATSGTSILKGSGSGGFSNAVAGTDYLAPNGSGASLTNVVNSITGTAGQVTASAATGAVTLSLPTALTGVNGVTAASATDLTLNGGSSGASLVLGQGASGLALFTFNGTSPYGLYAANTGLINSANAFELGGKLTPDAAGVMFAKVVAARDGTNNYNSYLGFYTEAKASGTTDTSTEKARITSGGNLLIGGTTDPGGNGNLKVFGTGTSSVGGPFGVQAAASVTTSAAGVHAFDTDAWAASRGAMQIYDGTANTYLVGVDASDVPSNGQVATWKTGGTITWESPSGGATMARTTSQFDKTSDTTLADVPGLSVTVSAGQTYFFEAIVFCSGLGGGGGYKLAVGGTATATALIVDGVGASSSAALPVSRVTTLGANVAPGTTNATASYRLSGTITVNAGGTLTIQFAQNSSNGTASSVLVGSVIRIQQF